MRASAPVSRPLLRDAALAGAAMFGGAFVLLGASMKFGLPGLAVPLLGVVALMLVRRPGAVALATIGAVVLAENVGFGLLPQTAHLYDDLVKGFMPLDALVLVAIAGTAVQVLQDRRPLRLPPAALGAALVLLALAILSGLLVGRDAGVGLRDAVLVAHVFVYLLAAPLVVVNLRFDERAVRRMLGLAVALAALKALVGLAVVALGRGETVDGSTLTYYEPTANWFMTVVLLGIIAALLGRVRLPWWAIASAPLLLLSLTLSYRRSFWIGDALALLLVLALGLGATGRRLLLPLAVVAAGSFWALGGVALQSDTPLGQRVQSLSSARISSNPYDRYRIDERANVVAAIRAHPVAGLGLGVPWEASARPLPVEANPTHQYVHFAVLYWWLKLGILGALAYVAVLASGALLAFRVWRRADDPLVRVFGLGSLCSIAALAVIETTATFTGTDPRFTLVFGGQLGLLAVLSRRPAGP
jgi:hypothetical protein